MYGDLSLIRKHTTKISLNDDEDDLVEAVVRYDGRPKAVLVRELLLEHARLVLAGQADLAPRAVANEGQGRVLQSA